MLFRWIVLLATATLGSAHAAPPTAPVNTLGDAPADYLSAMLSGGPGKDGIPAIDQPAFRDAARAADYLRDGDRVIGIYRNGEARAYPQRILVWHEIVNDRVGGDAVTVSYCPLTGTALGFLRGETSFGVSGQLVNSNLVMYDRSTDSYFPQIAAAGIRGPLAGEGLRELRVFWTTWGRWRERYPDTTVLTTDTGYLRNYRRDPYGGYNPRRGYYRVSSDRLFPAMHSDDRYPPKYEVLGFRDATQAVAVDPTLLAERGWLRYESGDADYLILHDPGLGTGWVFRGAAVAEVNPDAIRFTPRGPAFPQRNRLEPVNAFEAMWFAWVAFYPDTALLDG